MPKLLLRLTAALLAITIVGVSLSLAVGRTIRADLLTTALTTVTLSGNRYSPTDTIMLIDLTRHIRIPLRIPVEGNIDVSLIHWGGQQMLLQTGSTDHHMYYYNLVTNTLHEFPTTYTDPETGEVFRWDGVYAWTINDGNLWDYNAQNGGIFKIELGSSTIERVLPITAEVTSPSDISYFDNPTPSFSPDGTQVALADRHAIYIFDADGSNLRQYPNPIEETAGVYSYWSQDSRYLFISGFPDSPTAPMFFRVFDVSSEEILATTQNLEGNSFVPCGWNNEWVSYVNHETEGQLFNYQTGETINVSLNPELAGQPVEWLSWFNGCDWLLVTMEGESDNTSIGLEYQPLYLVSRDGQTVHSLGESVTLLSLMGEDRFLIAEAQGADNIIYEIHFDGTVHRTTIERFASTENRMSALYGDPYRWLVYEDQNNHISLLNIRSGVVETYFAANELINFPVYWRWE